MSTSKKKVANVPNARKVLDSLRHLSYTNGQAICDLVDNSFDAEATEVRIIFDKVSGTSLDSISIYDDGKGMPENILVEAMKLGSDTPKNALFDLGKFGMGLITASISMGRRLTVVSRVGNDMLAAIQDLDEIAKTNKFEVELVDNYDDLKNVFAEVKYLADHWTVVKIEKLDNLEYTNIGSFNTHLKEVLGETFRRFINNGKKIYLNGELVSSINPLEDSNAEIVWEGNVEIDGSKIHMRVGDMKADNATGVGQGLSGQGFYVIRNNRQIMKAETLGVYTRHPHLNRMRIELDYNGDLDDKAFKTGFRKSDVVLTTDAKSKIKSALVLPLKQIMEREKKKDVENASKDIDFTQFEKQVTSKASLLKKLKIIDEKRNPSDDKTPRKTIENPGSENHGPRVNVTGDQNEDGFEYATSKTNVKIRTKAVGKLSPICEPAQEGPAVVLYLNSLHPFYMEIVRIFKTDLDAFNTLMDLLYCYGKAELQFMDKNLDVMEQIRAQVAQEMVVLLNANR